MGKEDYPTKAAALKKIPLALTEAFKTTEGGYEILSQDIRSRYEPDLKIKVDDLQFAVAYQYSSSTEHLEAGFKKLEEVKEPLIPLIAVPYMGKKGAELCEARDMCWSDLSGNIRIVVGRVQIRIEGKPSRYKRRRRSNPFSPKASRVPRYMLMRGKSPMDFAELLGETGVSKGHLSRILLGLEEDELIVREADGKIYVPEPDDLLAVWMRKHTFRWHKAKRRLMSVEIDFPSRLGRVAGVLDKRAIPHAFTGYSGSHLQYLADTPEIVTAYLTEEPTEELFQELGATKEYGEWNLWLITPRDKGVLTIGAEEHGGYTCVHPVQTFLDLLEYPQTDWSVIEQHLGRLRGETTGSNQPNYTHYSEDLRLAMEEVAG